MKFTASLLFAGLVAFAPVASSAATLFGVSTSTGTAGNCPSFCTGGLFAGTSDGGENSTSAASSDNTYAQSRAEGLLGGVDSTPVLRAEASAASGKRGTATAFAIQGYTFNGTATETFLYNPVLTGTVTNGAGSSNNTISSGIAIMKPFGFGGDSFISDFGTFVYESFGYQRLAVENLFINTPGVDRAEGKMEFTLDAGDEFILVTELKASSRNGTADAFSTLVGSFFTSTGQSVSAGTFTAAASANPNVVPLPASAFLLGAALLGLGGMARRKAA